MSKVIEYKCLNCGGPLQFDSSSQKIKCPYCDAEFDIEEVKSYNEELANAEPEKMEWDVNSKEAAEAELEGLNVYHCDSCGAEIIAHENTSATICPFCESPVILKGRLSGVLKPDYVIPFKYDKDATKDALKNFLKKKLFLPNVFRTENKVEEVKGLYEPFWIYDTNCAGRVDWKAKNVRTYTQGDYRVKETKYYRIIREGSIGFDHIPVDGSSTMPDDLMESIEPFDFAGAELFNAAYLAGHMSDKYDVDKDVCANRANQRVREGTIDQFRSTIHGYDEVNYESSSLNLYDNTCHYALYPVWILNSKWKDKKFTFGMNAQTGKMVGNLPCSPLKYALWFIGFYLLTGALLGLAAGFFIANGMDDPSHGVLGGILVGALLGLITPIFFCRYHRKALKPVHEQHGAANYYRPGSMNITKARDIFLYRTVSRTKINTDNNRSGGPRR
jgi:DNA-directed RNA polymerase subunit RPC12/RpoP